ncbi:MAG: phage terminase large subunit, partial [Clostridia bacterium]|nr:phage terminase large subunit [Clostridia bacterium]
MAVVLGYEPTEKQRQFHACKADEVLFGGAAGGGKTYAIVMDAIDLCLRYKGIKAYIFRRSLKELEDNLIPIAREKIGEELGIYKAANHEMRFKNGSILRFRQLRGMDERFKYQGAEINALYIDELTHFTKAEYDFLKSRLRVKKELNFEPIVRCTTNPGGRGHGFVKSYFIDVAPYNTDYEERVYSEVLQKERVRRRRYIPALITDNPHISEEYIFELENKPKAIRDAYLLGKWDAFEGQVFTEWRDDPLHYEDRRFTHVIKPFALPKHFPKFRSFDFGYSRPFSVLWWAVGDEDEVYLYKEWYGAKDANVGIRLSPKEIARGILERDKGDVIKQSFADPSIWDSSRGESVALQM